jgi:signal transduction histidine kinase
VAVILGFASIVLGDPPEDDPRRKGVAEIRQAAERARDATHELLISRRLEVG